jgi:NDP-sugar pyrophosphorylase family protein
MLVYIVTYYGCNIRDYERVVWSPETKLFTTYEEAYKHYLYVTNIFQRNYDESTKKTYIFTNTHYDPNSKGGDYVVIQSRKDVGDEVDSVLIARCGMETL